MVIIITHIQLLHPWKLWRTFITCCQVKGKTRAFDTLVSMSACARCGVTSYPYSRFISQNSHRHVHWPGLPPTPTKNFRYALHGVGGHRRGQFEWRLLAICYPAKFKKNTTMCSLMQLAKIFICVFCMWCMVSMCLFNHVIHSTVQVCAIFQATGTSQSFYTCTGL